MPLIKTWKEATLLIKKILKKIFAAYYTVLTRVFYPQKTELLEIAPLFARGFILPQKILNINGCRSIPWPVHYTSKVFGDITTGKITTPGMSPGIYINGINGITFGDNIYIGPGVKIISANHSETNYQAHVPGQPIRIGDNVWIGANAVILPGISIGDNVIVGAGSVVTKNVPNDCIIGGNPAREIRRKEAYRGEINES